MDATLLRRACNTGYGRGTCDRFPSDAEADAIRFHVAASDDLTILVQCIRERDCWPAGSHTILYVRADKGFVGPIADPILQRQAEVFLSSCDPGLLSTPSESAGRVA